MAQPALGTSRSTSFNTNIHSTTFRGNHTEILASIHRASMGECRSLGELGALMGLRADKRGFGGCGASAREGNDRTEHVSREGDGRAGVGRLGAAGAQDDLPPEAGAWVGVNWGPERVSSCSIGTRREGFQRATVHPDKVASQNPRRHRR